MKVYCPECDAPVRVPSDHPPNKKVRCPECDLAFRPDLDDAPARGRRSRDDDRPRRSKGKGKKSSNTAALVAVPIVLLVLVGVGGAVAYFGFIKKKDDSGATADNRPPVGDSGADRNPPPPVPPKLGGPPGLGPSVSKVAASGKIGIRVGDTAQEIEGDDIDGKEFKLSDYRGKVVLLDFWGFW
jgi:hypothetical protein